MRYPTPFANVKKLVKFGEINYYFLKSAKEFDKLTFGNSELVGCKIWQNQNFDKPSNYGFSSSMMLRTNKLECWSPGKYRSSTPIGPKIKLIRYARVKQTSLFAMSLSDEEIKL